MAICRAYYTGYAAAVGECVPRFQEGKVIFFLRNLLGGVVIVVIVLDLLFPFTMDWTRISFISNPLEVVGLVLFAVSVFLYLWLHIALGKNFTDTVYVRKASRLVCSGPYLWVQHPMYVSGLLAAIGSALFFNNGLILVVGLVAMGLIIIWRTPIEERKLALRHGEAYQHYRKRTGRFLPKISTFKDFLSTLREGNRDLK